MNPKYEFEIEMCGEVDEEDLIVCPYCGCEHELHPDYFESNTEPDFDFECSECEKEFEVSTRIEYEYWAKTKPKSEVKA